MAWIKRNLLFVVGLAVAVVMVGGAGFYLYTAWDAQSAAEAEFQSKNQKLDELVKAEPYPNEANVKRAREEQDRVEKFKTEARRRFGVAAAPPGLNNASFKALLENTIAQLTHSAEQAGAKLPEGGYAFTFSEQRKQFQIPDRALAQLAVHLSDVKDICDVLYGARIHSLLYVKRPMVGTNDNSAASELLAGKKVSTNAVTGAAVYPYEISFQCFSSEIGSVLAGFRDAGQAYILKTINVERGTTTDAAAAMPVAMTPQAMMMSRYRMGPQAAPAAPPTNPNEPALEPKPLRVTIGLDIVKLSPPVTPAAPQKSGTAQKVNPPATAAVSARSEGQ
jgi:hypothetical protein